MIPRRFFWLLDAVALWLAFLSAYSLVPILHTWMEPGKLLYFPGLFTLLSPVAGQMPPLRDLFWIYLTVLAAALLVLLAFPDYGRLLYQSRMRIIVVSVLAALSGLSLVTMVTFALKGFDASRLFVVSFMLLSALILSAYRLLLRRYFLLRQRSGVYARNVLLVGQKSAIDWMVRYFRKYVSPDDYCLLGQLCANGDDAAADVPCLGNVTDLGDLLIHHPIHEVIAIQPLSDGVWMEGVIKACDYMGVLLRIVPQVLLRDPQKLMTLYPFAALNLPAVVLTPPRWDADMLFVKRVFDLIVSGVLLILLSPLFLAVAVAIKLTTPHLSVFYPWRVVGQNGVEFTGYKFTTMQADADERKADLQAKNEMSGPVFKIKDDPRVTPLGHWLRKFSINELPQLWSVFKGDMSLVGPRPAFRHELERYEFWHKRKLSIRPGITCLWQIRGRNKITNFDDWVRMDLEYIDHWSLWLDFRILVRTAWVVIAGTGS
ncbi:MAG: exopolysaccharide biosynthesis polyprenyl glycosylphosphotransferase [Anaerolineales bacterium]|nr:exopolysaccharide biosynthesis polyprenyl glycosylphosphotransferase [Anaerolineales bacterium]